MVRKALLFATIFLFLIAGTACSFGDENAGPEGEDGSTEVEANKAESDEGAGIAGEADPDADTDGDGGADADESGDGEAAEGAEATRVAFEEGAESARISGSLAAGGAMQRYVLRALAGQRMALRARGISNGAVVLSVHDASGELLATTAGADWSRANALQLDLTSAGDHTVSVSSGPDAPTLNYELEINITGEGRAVVDEGEDSDSDAEGDDGAGDAGGDSDAAADGADPLPIFFDAGETSTTVEGRLAGAGALRSYILRAAAGQRMELSLSSVPAGAVDAMVFNPGGRPMRSISRDALIFELATDGDYTVSTSSSAESATYSLDISVTDAPDAGDATDGDGDADAGDAAGSDEAPPTRVLFGPGEVSASYSGTLWDAGSHRYVLGASAGQTMRITLSPDEGASFQVTVEDEAGNVLASGLEGNALSIELPEDGDYVVEVLVAPGAPEASYTITMGIE